jgi:prepilin-type N-terminal cleavage/methylation domain-containing protein/prepilin-type processing-associated H-X9-DG protein
MTVFSFDLVPCVAGERSGSPSVASRRQQQWGGFTLVELLVVMGVLAVLAGLLLPVLARVREQARQSTCLSQLRQIALAHLMYVQDWDERLTSWYVPEPPSQASSMFPFVTWPPRDAGELVPGAGPPGDWPPALPGTGPRRWDGGKPSPSQDAPPPPSASGARQPPRPRGERGGGEGRRASPAFWTEYLQPYLRSTALLHDPGITSGGPSPGIRLADYAIFTWGSGGWGTPERPHWCWAGPHMALAAVRRPAETADVMDGVTTTQSAWREQGRHCDGTNVSFLDGHVRWLPPEEMARVDTDGRGFYWLHYAAADQ